MFGFDTLDQLKQLGIDPNDPEIKGRPFHSFKGTFKSIAKDPWMESSFKIKRSFLGWIIAQRKQSQGMSVDLPNLKAEIRNDFVRAQDLWEDYLVSKGEITPLTLGYEPARVVPTAVAKANFQVKRGQGSNVITKTEVQYRQENWQQNKPRYLTHEYLDLLEAENLRRTKTLNASRVARNSLQ